MISEFDEKPNRLLICGSRSFGNISYMHDKLYSMFPQILLEKTAIISGGAYGADSCAAIFARQQGLPFREIEAEWDLYGKSAGYIRNADMIDLCSKAQERSIVVAFWDGRSRGTKHTMDLAEKKGLALHVIRTDNRGLLR